MGKKHNSSEDLPKKDGEAVYSDLGTEYSDRRFSVFENRINLTNEINSEIQGDIVLPLMLDMPKRVEDVGIFLDEVSKRKNTYYFDRFVSDFYSSDAEFDKKRIVLIPGNKELLSNFLELLELDLKVGVSNDKYSEKRKKVAVGLYSVLFDVVPAEVDEGKAEKFLDGVYNKFLISFRRESFGVKIFKSGKPEAIRMLVDGMNRLRTDVSNEELNGTQYIRGSSEVYRDAAKQTGDEQLIEEWKYYQQEEERLGAVALFVPDSDAEEEIEKEGSGKDDFSEFYDAPPVRDSETLNHVVSSVEALGYSATFDDTGFVSVNMGDGLPPVGFNVYEGGAGDVVYRFRDDYINEPSWAKGDDFKYALDSRAIDVRLSEELKPYFQSDSISEVPDAFFSNLGRVVIGSSEEREYMIGDAQALALRNLAKILSKKDDKYVSLSKKIDFLNNFLGKSSRGRYVYSLLVDSDKDALSKIKTVSDLVDFVEGGEESL